MSATAPSKNYSVIIALLSVVLLGAVAFLYYGPKLTISGFDPMVLPPINAVINGLTTLLLVAGFWAIKNGNISLHKRIMTSALAFSVLFLLAYVTYHSTAEHTPYCEEGPVPKAVYLGILFSHIVLAAAIVPLVLITLVRAWSEKFDKHRKIARITLPLWLYVSITGVVVYLLISPCYPV